MYILMGSVPGSPIWAATEQDVIRVGIVPQFEQRRTFKTWRPILDELEKTTHLKFKLVGSPKISVFADHVRRGDYDLVYMNPYHILTTHTLQGYIPLVREGAESLRGILVVRRDSGIDSPRQLSGKVIAFPSPNALGASMLLRAGLKQEFNLRFEKKYVQTHTSVYLHVAKNLVVAGGGVNRTLAEQKAVLRNQLKVIYQTRPVTPHPIAIHPRISRANRIKIKNALIQLAKTKHGKQLLSKIPIKKLVRARISDYYSLKEMGLERYYIK